MLWDKQSLALDLRATGERIKTLEQVIERVRAGKLELELKLEQLRGSRLDLEESQIEGELEKIRTRALEGRQITGELEEIRTRLFGLEREIDRERNRSTELVNSLSGLLGLTTELEQIVVKGRDQCLMREREQDQVRALERARAHTPGRVGTWLSKAMSIRGSLPRR